MAGTQSTVESELGEVLGLGAASPNQEASVPGRTVMGIARVGSTGWCGVG